MLLYTSCCKEYSGMVVLRSNKYYIVCSNKGCGRSSLYNIKGLANEKQISGVSQKTYKMVSKG